MQIKHGIKRLLALLLTLVMVLGMLPMSALAAGTDVKVRLNEGSGEIGFESCPNEWGMEAYLAIVSEEASKLDIKLPEAFTAEDGGYTEFSEDFQANTWKTITLSNYGPFPIEVDFPVLESGYKYYTLWANTYESLYIIRVGKAVTPATKETLIATIAEAQSFTAPDDTRVYRTDDRYNGKADISETAPYSFYSALADRDYGALPAALKLFIDSDVTKDLVAGTTEQKITTAQNKLRTAIDNLIPTEFANPSNLYGALKNKKKNPAGYTAKSWTIYEQEMQEAEALLGQLFDTNGNPATMNKSSDTALMARIQYLSESPWRLSYLIESFSMPYRQLTYDSLKRLFALSAPERLNTAVYTDESLAALAMAREKTDEFLKSNPDKLNPDNFGSREQQEMETITQNLWTAYCGLADKKESVTVTVKVIDGMAARYPSQEFPFTPLSGIYTVTLSGGKTMADLKSKISFTERSLNTVPLNARERSIRYTLINGLWWDEAGISGSGAMIEDSARQLHDGDMVTLAYADHPTVAGSAGVGQDLFDIAKITTLYQSAAILQNGQRVKEILEIGGAQPLSLSAVKALVHPKEYTGSTSPLEGATVFVSPAASETAGGVQPASRKTAVITDAGGNFSYAFYGEGYYALSVYALDANNAPTSAPGLIAGDTIYIHVSGVSQEQNAAVRTQLLAELETVYKAYPESFFNAADWRSLSGFYNAGVTAMNAAENLAAMKDALDTAIAGIRDVQNSTIADNTTKLDGFRRILSRLPDDAALLGSNGAFLVDDLIARCDAMSAYQKSRLTGVEEAKFTALKAAREAGLPEKEPYQLKIEVAADTSTAKTAIEAMVAYVAANGQNAEDLHKFTTFTRDLDGGDTFSTRKQNASAVAPDSSVVFSPSVNLSSYSMTAGAKGTGWEILPNGLVLEPNTTADSSKYVAVKNRTILIGGIPYEIKSVRAAGADTLTSQRGTVAHGTEANATVAIPDVYYRFIMPYQDVTVTVTWGPVGNASPNDSPELVLAKMNGADAVNYAYASYRSSDYTDSSWVALTAAKNTGLDAIAAAKSEGDVTAAQSTAIAAMAAIAKKTVIGEIPSFGKVVGTVSVSVENTTFDGGAFKGVILSEPVFEYAENDTMMTIVLRALKKHGFEWTGTGGTGSTEDYKIAYLATIKNNGKSMGEFSGEPGSGWMGTLNDFFVNEGFQQFSAKNGKLSDGDEIRVMFTQNLGADIGGSWGNSDTSLARLNVSAGTMYPAFDSGIQSYTLILPASASSLKVTPEAANKNYMVKTFLNEKVTTNTEGVSFYKRTQYIPVRPGDLINIGVGEYAWPSMNKQETEARNYSGTWYKLGIITADKGAEHVVALISELPSARSLTMTHEGKVANIRAIFNALSSSERGKVTNLQKLIDSERQIASLKKIENVKTLLSKIPAAEQITLSHKAAVVAADKAYKELTEEEKRYITVGDVKNYNAAIEKLTELGAFKPDETPSPIQGSDKAPEGPTTTLTPKAEVKDGEAKARVGTDNINKAIEEAKKSGSDAIVIAPEITGSAKKVSVEVPKSSVSDIGKNTEAGLKIETPVGSVTIPNSALASVASQAAGSSVTVSMEAVDTKSLTSEQQKIVGSGKVFDISITSDGRNISSFGGGSVTISLPYALKAGEDPKNVTVWYLNDAGQLGKMSCTYDKSTGQATFKTIHLSKYIVGYAAQGTWKNPFTDVKTTDWFYGAVEFVAKNGLFNGTTTTTFGPNISVTRAMLVTVLYRFDGSPAVTGKNTFKDVKNGQWYTNAVIWANANGITGGYGNGWFGTNDSITREQLAAILYRYAKYKGYDVTKAADLKAYTDASAISSWAQAAMKWANVEGIITEVTTTKLAPGTKVTRAEVAMILQRFAENIVK